MFRQRPYTFSFTAASVRPEMVGAVADRFVPTGSWDSAKTSVLTSNALQARSVASSIRMEREIRQRLQTLTIEQLRLLPGATSDLLKAVGWLAAAKHSAFVYDFAAECLRTKLGLQDATLRLSDYECFVAEKLPLHPELGKLAESTYAKVRRVLFLMLKEAGLLEPGPELGVIRRPVLSPALAAAIARDDPRWLAAFLVPDSEIQMIGGVEQ
jgi:Putative inner membrane protein (DUF1819)